MIRHEYAGAAAATTVVGALSSSATSITVAAATNWPTGGANGPFSIVLDKGLSTEEKVLIDSRSGTLLTVAASGRGYDGTSAAAHTSGAAAEHCITRWDINEFNDHGSTAARDDHTQYMHISTARTVTAVHTLSNGLMVGTRLNAASLKTGSNLAIDTLVTATNAFVATSTTLVTLGVKMIASQTGDGFQLTDSADVKVVSWEADGKTRAKGSHHRFGAGAQGGAGTNILIGDEADAANAYLESEGSPANVGLNLRTKGTGTFSLYRGATLAATLDTNNNLNVIGNAVQFGTGALGASGAFVKIGDLGNAGSTYVIAQGTGANISVSIRSKGTSSVYFETGVGNGQGDFDTTGEAASNSSSLRIRVNNTMKRVEQHATADSAGTGYRTLRVAN